MNKFKDEDWQSMIDEVKRICEADEYAQRYNNMTLQKAIYKAIKDNDKEMALQYIDQLYMRIEYPALRDRNDNYILTKGDLSEYLLNLKAKND